jgi:Dolichyl-phosphate-mannose-protein mannosyltransferase
MTISSYILGPSELNGASTIDTAAASAQASYRTPALILTLGLIPLRLALGSVLGLSDDESYVAVMARHPSLSYVDHPPLTMWLNALAQWIAGDSDVAIRAPAILLFAGTTWMIYRIGGLLFSPRAGFFAALALNLAPLFGVALAGLATTDGAMLFGLAAATLCLSRALFLDSPAPWRDWSLAGLFFGLSMLSKYNVALAAFGLAMFLCFTPQQRFWLARPQPYLAALIALAVFSPVLIWNYQHDWISFRFQGTRAWSGDLQLVRFLYTLGAQALVLLPWIWLPLIVVLIVGITRGPTDQRRWFLCWLALSPLAVFTFVRLISSPHDYALHWTAPGYLLLFPLLGAAVVGALPQHRSLVTHLLRGSIMTIVIGLGLLVSHALTGWLQTAWPSFAKRDPLIADQADWNDVRGALARLGLLDRRDLFLAGDRWADCVKIELAVKTMPVHCITPEPLQYRFIHDPREFSGRDAVVVTHLSNLDELRREIGASFERLELLDRVTVTQHGVPALPVMVVLGRSYRAPEGR